MKYTCQEQDCESAATQQGVHASSDCLIKVCDEHAEEITQEGHWVPGYEPRPLENSAADYPETDCACCLATASLELSPLPNPKRVPGIPCCGQDKHVDKLRWLLQSTQDSDPGLLDPKDVFSAEALAWVDRWNAAYPR